MDITHRVHGIAFEWDQDKAVGNNAKHGVDFERRGDRFRLISSRPATPAERQDYEEQ
jgi:uncharacterized DUF497 family protein